MSKKIKVLVVTYDFFPDSTPNTYRWLNVLKEWSKRDVEIFVVSAQKVGFLDYEEVDGIKIFRTGNSWFDKIKNKIFHLSNKDVGVFQTTQNRNIAREGIIRKVYNFTWKKIYFPDFAFLWQASAYRKAQELIIEKEITNIVTVSWPFSDHVIGSKLKKNNEIFWIADTIDPFYLSKAVNNNFLYNSLNYKYEKSILHSADVVTVLTDRLKKKYASLYPAITDKIIVNHNIFVPYIIDRSTATKSGKIKLVFVGTLTPITRSPENLLKLFVSLLKKEQLKDRLELYFYGDSKQCAEIFNQYHFLIDKKIFVKGLVPRSFIPNILDDANVVVNIGNSNEYQEPSKILEYIYLGKPILNVCTVENDSSIEILSKYSLSFNVFERDIIDDQKTNEILDFMMKNQSVERGQSDKILWKYLLPEVERRYFELISK